jgi:peptidoglycan/LPS O-acetylase OafA/YrhL
MNTERRYDIDWLRVIAIGLLLIYHIAIIFQPWAVFIGFMRSTKLMEGLWYPMTLLNVWRIPLLFFVSGMGVYFAMQKRNVKQLLLERGKRILLPYLFGIVAVVPLHFFIFQDFYGQQLTYFAHPAHLWFLGNLVIYISLLFPVFFYLLKKQDGKFRKVLIKIMSNPLGPAVITFFFVLEVLIVKPQIFSLYAQTVHGYAMGFLAFFFGFILVYAGQPFWNTVQKWKAVYLGAAAILFAVRLIVNQTGGPNFLMAIESNLWIISLFGYAYQYLNRPSKVLAYLSKAVYPIYMVHMFVLYGAAWLVIPLEIPVFLQFTLIVIITAVVCIVLYEILKRIPILRNAFGIRLKLKTKRKTTGSHFALNPTNNHHNLLAVAYENSLNSKTVFKTFFKKIEGMTPKAWLRSSEN